VFKDCKISLVMLRPPLAASEAKTRHPQQPT
jgi:hypothetical protein